MALPPLSDSLYIPVLPPPDQAPGAAIPPSCPKFDVDLDVILNSDGRGEAFFVTSRASDEGEHGQSVQYCGHH